MTEIFNELAVVGDPVDEEDRVVHLLASLPKSFNMLVTAMEVSSEVPAMESVTERLLHEERKRTERADGDKETALASRGKKKFSFKCYHCNKSGHYKKNCPQLKKLESTTRPTPYKSSKYGKAKAYQLM